MSHNQLNKVSKKRGTQHYFLPTTLYEQQANDAVTTRLSRANQALLDANRSYKTSILGRGGYGAKRDVIGHWDVRPQAVAPNGKKNTFEIECKITKKIPHMQVFVGFFVVLPIHVLQEKVGFGEILPFVRRRRGIDGCVRSRRRR